MHSSLFSFLAPPPGQQGSGAMMIVVIQIGALLAIFWFLLIRPQRMQAKQHEEMLKGLKRGDEIVTSGGIVGKVVHLKDDRVTIESGESRVVIERERVAKVLTAPAAEPAAK
ncbi:MAG: preprotein translocase subunit YajC [Gemmatimonadales bacterium]